MSQGGRCGFVWVPFIQDSRKVLNAATVILSIGGSSGRSTLIFDGSSKYPASNDQIAAASTGSITNKMMQTAGQLNSAM